jgi:hypothetical protein
MIVRRHFQQCFRYVVIIVVNFIAEKIEYPETTIDIL